MRSVELYVFLLVHAIRVIKCPVIFERLLFLALFFANLTLLGLFALLFALFLCLFLILFLAFTSLVICLSVACYFTVRCRG